MTLYPHKKSHVQTSYTGEEFGYVLEGSVLLHLGEAVFQIKKGESFCFDPEKTHYIENTKERPAKFLWVSTPPSF